MHEHERAVTALLDATYAALERQPELPIDQPELPTTATIQARGKPQTEGTHEDRSTES